MQMFPLTKWRVVVRKWYNFPFLKTRPVNFCTCYIFRKVLSVLSKPGLISFYAHYWSPAYNISSFLCWYDSHMNHWVSYSVDYFTCWKKTSLTECGECYITGIKSDTGYLLMLWGGIVRSVPYSATTSILLWVHIWALIILNLSTRVLWQ
jgi:hypothetical protein